MSQSTVLHTQGVRRKVLVGVGAIAVLSVFGTSRILVPTPPSIPGEVQAALPVLSSVPAVSAQARDTWYLEPKAVISAPGWSAQARDTWYLEPKAVISAPGWSAQARDTWYLESTQRVAAESGT